MRRATGMRAMLAAAALLAGEAMSADMAAAATVNVDCPGTAASTDREFRLKTAVASTCVGWGNGALNAGVAGLDPLLSLLGPGYALIDRTDSGAPLLTFTNVGQRSGSWTLLLPAAPVGFSWGALVIGMQSEVAAFNPDWAGFGLAPSVAGGWWSIANGSQNLVYAGLYGELLPSAVPLPAAGLVLAGGLAALGALRRRRRRG